MRNNTHICYYVGGEFQTLLMAIDVKSGWWMVVDTVFFLSNLHFCLHLHVYIYLALF